ncbi:conserved hypothetical protein [Neospora caninum Liverpool]|uniref:Transmembrane protein n=1 Tax=Neospora caninum (strain Liverpool) TaxID=572307 RepID=F0VCU0_NEOCL|nr:conserved hypothetical protein [Neospora caninum Liverpool]CBZ51455.1 conserved hypothetical protein [Neospora caninum Liverpool]CEL65404.1 TPA: hypothetical protein BN1204_012530 [Neospora caninum Liverpool]|eukprot:XP_003881488.1 conserved hypothetical protein [Neospora caninum Liverpool]
MELAHSPWPPPHAGGESLSLRAAAPLCEAASSQGESCRVSASRETSFPRIFRGSPDPSRASSPHSKDSSLPAANRDCLSPRPAPTTASGGASSQPSCAPQSPSPSLALRTGRDPASAAPPNPLSQRHGDSVDEVLVCSRAEADRIASARRASVHSAFAVLPGLSLRLFSFFVAFLSVFAVHLHIASLSLLVRREAPADYRPNVPSGAAESSETPGGALRETELAEPAPHVLLRDLFPRASPAASAALLASPPTGAHLPALVRTQNGAQTTAEPAQEALLTTLLPRGKGARDTPAASLSSRPEAKEAAFASDSPNGFSFLDFSSFRAASALFPPSLLTSPSPLPAAWPFAEDLLIAWHLACQALGCLFYGFAADFRGRRWVLSRALKLFTVASLAFTVCALLTARMFHQDQPVPPPHASSLSQAGAASFDQGPPHKANASGNTAQAVQPYVAGSGGGQARGRSEVKEKGARAGEAATASVGPVWGWNQRRLSFAGSSERVPLAAPRSPPRDPSTVGGETSEHLPRTQAETQVAALGSPPETGAEDVGNASPEDVQETRTQSENRLEDASPGLAASPRAGASFAASEESQKGERPFSPGFSDADDAEPGSSVPSFRNPAPRSFSPALALNSLAGVSPGAAGSKWGFMNPDAFPPVFSWQTVRDFGDSLWRSTLASLERAWNVLKSSSLVASVVLLPFIVAPVLALLFFSLAAAACGGVFVVSHCICFEAAASFRLSLHPKAAQAASPPGSAQETVSPGCLSPVNGDSLRRRVPGGREALDSPLLAPASSRARQGASLSVLAWRLQELLAAVCSPVHGLFRRQLETPHAVSRFAFSSSPYIPIAYLVAIQMAAHFFLPVVLSAFLSQAAPPASAVSIAPFPLFCLAASFPLPLCLLLLLITDCILAENPYFLSQRVSLLKALRSRAPETKSPRRRTTKVHPTQPAGGGSSDLSPVSSVAIQVHCPPPSSGAGCGHATLSAAPFRTQRDSPASSLPRGDAAEPGGVEHPPASSSSLPAAFDSEALGSAVHRLSLPNPERASQPRRSTSSSELLAPLLPADGGTGNSASGDEASVSPRSEAAGWCCLSCCVRAGFSCLCPCARRSSGDRGTCCPCTVPLAAKRSIPVYRQYLKTSRVTSLWGVTAPAAFIGAAFSLRGFFRFLLLDCVVLEATQQGFAQNGSPPVFSPGQAQTMAALAPLLSVDFSWFNAIFPSAPGAAPIAPGPIQSEIGPELHLFQLCIPVMLVRVLTAILPVFLLSLLPPKPLQMVGGIVCGFMSFGIALTLTTLSQRFPSIPPISASKTASLLYEIVFCWCSFAPAFTVALLPLQGFHTGVRGGAAAAASACVRAGAGLAIIVVQLLFRVPSWRNFPDIFSNDDPSLGSPLDSAPAAELSSTTTVSPPGSMQSGGPPTDTGSVGQTSSDDACSAEAVAAAMFACGYYVIAAALTLMLTTHVRLPTFFGDQLIEEEESLQQGTTAEATGRIAGRNKRGARPELRRLVSQRWGAQWVEGEEEGVGVILDRLYLHLVTRPGDNRGGELEEDDEFEELADEVRFSGITSEQSISQTSGTAGGEKDSERCRTQVLRSRRTYLSPD